jgi:hypothetical protein
VSPRTIYVTAPSAAHAERWAALDPAMWFATEQEAADWLASRISEASPHCRVYEVTHLHGVWTAREPLTFAGIAARVLATAAGFAAMAYAGGWMTVVERAAS